MSAMQQLFVKRFVQTLRDVFWGSFKQLTTVNVKVTLSKRERERSVKKYTKVWAYGKHIPGATFLYELCCYFLQKTFSIKRQFLDPETDKKCQIPDTNPETDIMEFRV